MATSVTKAQQDQIAQLYVSLFNRAPDAGGFAGWVESLAKGTSLNVIAQDFYLSPEGQATYSRALTNQQFVEAFYTKFLGRNLTTEDKGGITYWVGRLGETGATHGAIAAEIIKNIVNYTGTDPVVLASKAIIDSKVAVGEHYALVLNGNVAGAAAAVDGVINATTAAAKIADLGVSGTIGSTFTLTAGVDQGTAFAGTSANDTFVATIDGTGTQTGTLNTADVLVGGAGNDVLNLTVTATNTAALNAASISGVETINVRAAGVAVTATVDATSAVGATAVNANQGAGAVVVTGLAKGAAIGVIGNGSVTNGAVTFGYATVADDVTINLSGGTKVGTTITNSAIAGTATVKATINSTGAANVIGALDLDGNTVADLAALVVNATTDLTATLIADDYVVTGAALTVTGAGKVNVGAAGTFKTVDASANTGGLTMTIDTVTTSLKGSTGNDTITTATLAAPAAGIIDAGAGTADKLVVAAVADVATAALRGSYTNFEVLSNATATNAQIAADGFTGITSLETAIAGGGFSGMTAAQAATINVTADLAATATAYALATAAGTSDVLGLNFKSATATTVENATALNVTGFETLNLTAASGSTTLYNAAGTTQLTAGATTLTAGVPDGYDSFAIGVATTDLKTVTLAGGYAAKVDLSANATKVTVVNASTNTAGADLVIGGQTGTVVVTGTESRDIITLNAAGAGGLQTVNAGGGNDSIFAAQAVVAVATINGGAGTDTLNVNDAGPVVVNDNNFAGISSIEKLAFGAATGLTFSVGGFANGLATANAGVLDVTAAAYTAAVTIDGTGLSATNSLKLSLTNIDAAVAATATTITLSQGADNITIKQAGATNVDTISINGGVAALASTAVKTIDLSGVTVGGTITVTTGAGNDVIKAAAVDGTYTGGLGSDTFTAGAGVDTFVLGTNGSVIGTSLDKITSFSAADKMTFAATLAVTADATVAAAGSNVSQNAAGLLTFATADNTLALKIAAIQADVQLDAAGSIALFTDGANQYVYFAGAAIGNADDQLIELTGITTLTTVVGGAATITFA